MNSLWQTATLLLTLLASAGCTSSPRVAAPPDWIAWHARRAESVAGTNGWTTLIGLEWLREGANSAGSAPVNDAIIHSDRVPANLGVFTRRGSAVSFTSAPDADIRVSGERVQKIDLVTDASPNPTRLQVGSVSIIVIQRGERVGLRVRDAESAARRNFKGLRYFPYDPAWRIEARFVPFEQVRKLRVPDVTGSFQEFESPGEIVFTTLGSERRLVAALEPEVKDYFIMFHDETAGQSTYPAGRFLYVEKPLGGDRVIIDFNRAYTPPCGLTEFATCPLPPRQNFLSFPINAGELAPANGHH